MVTVSVDPEHGHAGVERRVEPVSRLEHDPVPAVRRSATLHVFTLIVPSRPGVALCLFPVEPSGWIDRYSMVWFISTR